MKHRLIFCDSILILLFCGITQGQKVNINIATHKDYVTNPRENLAESQIQVKVGWNLLSLPLEVADGVKSTLFPTAISDAFIFQNYYVAKDTLENGIGFWIKFDSADTFIITGESIDKDTISVQEGWNMIGSLTSEFLLSTIRSEPDGIIVSECFVYVPGMGYQEEYNVIPPGCGFWIKVNQNGLIFLSSMDIPCPGLPTVTYAGKVYNTVQIGNQCWLKENLDIGTMILGSDTAKDNGIIEKYCYNDSVENCNIYGGLYQWNEVMQYKTVEGTQGICPEGWHIPTYAEFQTLNNTVGSDGNALKEIGQGTGNGAGTNTTGFSALLSGDRFAGGTFKDLYSYALFWSSTEYVIHDDSSYALIMYLRSYSGYISLNMYAFKGFGFSVRCIKD